jgi:thiamine biosynthesis protein ThiS
LKITINGEEKTITSTDLLLLVTELGMASKKVAIEHNKKIISKADYEATKLSSGDSIEIVHFIGGG